MVHKAVSSIWTIIVRMGQVHWDDRHGEYRDLHDPRGCAGHCIVILDSLSVMSHTARLRPAFSSRSQHYIMISRRYGVYYAVAIDYSVSFP